MQESSDKCMGNKEVWEYHKQVEIFISDIDAKLFRECVERRRESLDKDVETLEDKDELCNELKTATEEDKLVEMKGETGEKDENNLETLQRNEEIDQNDEQIRYCEQFLWCYSELLSTMDKLKNMSDNSRNGSWSGIFFSYFNMDIRLTVAKSGFSFFSQEGWKNFRWGASHMQYAILDASAFGRDIKWQTKVCQEGEATFQWG